MSTKIIFASLYLIYQNICQMTKQKKEHNEQTNKPRKIRNKQFRPNRRRKTDYNRNAGGELARILIKKLQKNQSSRWSQIYQILNKAKIQFSKVISIWIYVIIRCVFKNEKLAFQIINQFITKRQDHHLKKMKKDKSYQTKYQIKLNSQQKITNAVRFLINNYSLLNCYKAFEQIYSGPQLKTNIETQGDRFAEFIKLNQNNPQVDFRNQQQKDRCFPDEVMGQYQHTPIRFKRDGTMMVRGLGLKKRARVTKQKLLSQANNMSSQTNNQSNKINQQQQNEQRLNLLKQNQKQNIQILKQLKDFLFEKQTDSDSDLYQDQDSDLYQDQDQQQTNTILAQKQLQGQAKTKETLQQMEIKENFTITEKIEHKILIKTQTCQEKLLKEEFTSLTIQQNINSPAQNQQKQQKLDEVVGNDDEKVKQHFISKESQQTLPSCSSQAKIEQSTTVTNTKQSNALTNIKQSNTLEKIKL